MIKAQYATVQNELQGAGKRESTLQNELQKAGKEESALQNELQEAGKRESTLQNEVQEAGKRESAAQQELLKQKERYNETKGQLDELKGQRLEIEKEIERLQPFEGQYKEMGDYIKTLEAQVKGLNEKIEKQADLVAETKKEEKESPLVSKEKYKKPEGRSKAKIEVEKKRIGEILLESKFITEDMLNEAIEYQEKFGGGITQYLLTFGYVSEEDLAQCVSSQFGFPYLPLRLYSIPKEIIKLIPADIAKKYWLIPVDKVGDVLTVVMADPLDTQAIKKVEVITGCKVHPFVGLLSDIIEEIERYYNVSIEEKRLIHGGGAPLFIDIKAYKGVERRKSIRIKAKIDIYLPSEGQYKKYRTKDVSPNGFLIESEHVLPIGSYSAVQIDLPAKFYSQPIATVMQVSRVVPLENSRFDIGLRFLRITKEDLKLILEYARKHKE